MKNHADIERIQARKKIKELETLIQLNELNTKKFSKDLQGEKVNNEKLKNQLIEFKHTNSLVKMETDILGGRLNIVTNSIKSLGDAKEAEEKYLIKMNQFKEEISEYVTERNKLESKVSELLKDRDVLQTQLKEMNAARLKANDEKDKFLKLSKERVNIMEKELKGVKTQNAQFKEDIDNLDKSLKLSNQEKEFLRERINQMKLKRNININGKICRNWNKDYLEKENFKWSWVTHLREWSGKMWWWWGSTDKSNPGCKTDYHISKSYLEMDENKLTENNNEVMMKKLKCRWCKEIGHSLKDWPQDPNIRTNHPISDEYSRVEGLKDIVIKKYAADIMKKTEKFFKTAIVVRDKSPFKRGILLFDDYNYQYLNKAVLPTMDELIEAEGDEDDSEESKHESKDINYTEEEGDAEGDNEYEEAKKLKDQK